MDALEPIVYVDRSRIRSGRAAQLKQAIAELAAFIERREPQLSFYGFSFDDDSMTVVAVHPDSASLQLHLQVGESAFRRLGDLLDLETIEIFGSPSDGVMEQLRGKARMLGERGDVRVCPFEAGFSRLQAVSAGVAEPPGSAR